MFESLLTGVLLRYAATIAGSAAASVGAYAIAHWGATPETVAAVGGGIATVGGAVVLAISKNASAGAVLSRIPIKEALDAIAGSTKVMRIRLHDPALASDVPSPKVVGPLDPAGNSNVT
jgi:hypothetical protein